MTHQEIAALYEERVPKILPFIKYRAWGDQDMVQIGRISVFTALKANPAVSDNWRKNNAKYAMNDELKRGRSLDKKNLNRKFEYEIVPLIDEHDRIVADLFPADKHTDLETQVLNKISMERFWGDLTGMEIIYASLKVHDEMPDSEIRKWTGWSQDRIKEVKKSIRAKMDLVFTC